MTTPLTPLSQLLVSNGNADDIVSSGGGGLRRRADFHRDVSSLMTRIVETGGKRWLIADGDTYTIAVGVFAVLHAGGQVILPANLQEGHLADVAADADGVLAETVSVPAASTCLAIFDPSPGSASDPLMPIDSDRAEIVLHTSGTTGIPTSIRKPLRCFEAELASQTKVFAPMPGKTVIATVPPYHIYGLLFRVLWPLATNRPFSTDTVSYPEELVTAAEAHPGCMFASSPAFLKRALSVLDLDRLRGVLGPVFSSGGLLPPPTAADYNAVLATPIVEVYGSTETGGIAHRSVFDADAPPPWQPLPGVDVEIDPETQVLSVRSPFMPDGEWFRAGDRAVIEEDGRFVLRGRADRIVKVEEERVSLPELEQRLTDNQTVAAARVVLLPAENDERQVIGAVIEPSEAGWETLVENGRTALRTILLDALRPHLAAIVLPRKWRFVTRLPEDDRGKTSDASLASLFQEGQGAVMRPEMTVRESGPDRVVLDFELPEDLFYFDGHFDDTPILAGVVQIDWAVELAREHLGVAGVFRRIEALKFFNVLMAGDAVSLTLDYDNEGQKLSFEYSRGDTRHSSGRIIFENIS